VGNDARFFRSHVFLFIVLVAHLRLLSLMTSYTHAVKARQTLTGKSFSRLCDCVRHSFPRGLSKERSTFHPFFWREKARERESVCYSCCFCCCSSFRARMSDTRAPLCEYRYQR
jgi:hypothetical protein